MNVGIHDAVNLAWKLGGVVRGYYSDDVLHTYEAERRPAAEILLRLDKTFSTLISGQIPKDLANSAVSNPNELLHTTFLASIEFNIGLGISYEPSIINVAPTTTMIGPGHRAPDALLHPPGARIPTHLFQLTKNTSAFWVIVFAGLTAHTSAGIRAFRKYLDDNDGDEASASFAHKLHPSAFRLLTIIAGSASQANEALGVPSFGHAYYDLDHSAHVKYGISPQAGAVIVLRPDGIFGFAATLDRGKDVGDYFNGFCCKDRT
jgi:phenol 2-monooxygenase